MPFSEKIKDEVKRRAHFTCCWCRDPRNKVEIHHIVPQAENGPDEIDNAAPLCGSCHDLLGDNPKLQKEVRGRRDLWYRICAAVVDDDEEQTDRHLTKLERLKAKLEAEGGDTTEVIGQILDHRRRLREGKALVAGDVLGTRYELQEVIGQGGFAVVWKAFDLPLVVMRDASKFVAGLDAAAPWRDMIEKAVEWEVKDRYATMAELCQAFEAPPSIETSLESVEPERETAPARPHSKDDDPDNSARFSEPEPPEPEPPPLPVVVMPAFAELFQWIETPKDGRVELWQEIPAGEGWIGSPEDEVGDSDERPRRRIMVVQPFQMAAVPVTNVQYAAFMPGYKFKDEEALQPVVNVSWNDATAFCHWLGKTFSWAHGARLPTEEEWEYACRAGTKTRYWSGDSEDDLARVGWYAGNSGRQTHRVGEKEANPWGLYDMHGNIWEWTATVQGSDRVRRGGSWSASARSVRAAYRFRYDPSIRGSNLGFRLVRGPSTLKPGAAERRGPRGAAEVR